jgi:hypothetical protein
MDRRDFHLLSIPTLDWVDKLKDNYKDDLLIKELVTKWLTNQLSAVNMFTGRD